MKTTISIRLDLFETGLITVITDKAPRGEHAICLFVGQCPIELLANTIMLLTPSKTPDQLSKLHLTRPGLCLTEDDKNMATKKVVQEW